MKNEITLTDIDGILLGHETDLENRTGCTAILCPDGAAAGVDVCGFAPASRETELLDPAARVDVIHGILLTGGSAFGLGAANGVVRWLAENGYGLETLFAKVPLVPAAGIYDLNFNQTLGKPDEEMGYRAACNASSEPVRQGCIGAGTGATAGKIAGFDRAMKSGFGSAGAKYGDIKIAAVAVVNPVGDVVDPRTGNIIAGVRNPDGSGFSGAEKAFQDIATLIKPPNAPNTVLCVVATNARLDKLQTSRIARMSSSGIAQAVRPAHLLYDGDIVFALSTGTGPEIDENIIGSIGAEVIGEAIANAARHADSVPGFPAWKDYTL